VSVTNEELQEIAMFVAMVVRNTMEDFHAEHLSDDQMRELNPLIRNGVYTALWALEHRDENPAVEFFAAFHESQIPDYWEAPKLTEDFENLLARFPELMRGKAPPAGGDGG
jgi:hypothetical protein